MIEFRLPSLGADMDEGKLLAWRIRPGDTVRRGDVVAVVDTSKAAVDVEIWSSGVVHELVVQPGETVPVGTVLATLLAPGETAPPPGAPRAAGTAATPAPALAAAAPGAPAVTAAAPAPVENLGRRRISPAARKRAEELGVDLDTLTGTGPGAAVVLEDVEAAGRARAARTAAPAPAAPADRAQVMRRAMAAAMARSKREIPHYYLARTVPLGTATTWLAARNATRPITERVLMAVLFVKAAALACRRHPVMNGFCRDGAFEAAERVHAGIAVSLRGGGLVAPAIHDADRKDLATLMADLSDLVRRARAGSLRSSEMSDPTVTVTNLGEQGADSVLGVIYPPQVALVGFGAVAERAWVRDGWLGPMPCVTVSLAADHRVSTGHQGALFLGEIAALLQQPETL